MIKFTLMIPTRERCETLKYTLASCVAQHWDNLEIIVSDNASADATRDVVAAFDDSRIRYVNTGRRRSMTGNFEFALSHATGDYLMFLGDDDGLTPDALPRVARIIRETGVEAVTSSQALYHWPNALDEKARNRLVFCTREGHEIRSTRQVLQDVLDFKRPYTELPGSYAGCVSRKAMTAAMFNGVYFHSITPDAYSGVVNAAVMDRYVYAHAPFAVAGLSGRSNGASHLGSTASQEASMYEKENDLPFHSGLIFCPSNEVIMAEAFLQAKERLPQLDALRLDLGRVCDMALAEAPVWNYLKVQAAVSGIRRLHGLPHIDRESKSRVEKIHSSARRLRRGLGRLRDRYKNLNCADFSVCDVKAAGELMSIVNAYVAHAYDSSFKTWLRWLSRV